VLPLTPTNAQGRALCVAPLLGSLQALFNTDRRLAIVPNVGPLVMPTTKAQVAMASHPKPASLFSHNDQQNTWQALAPEGAIRGWGGRMGDALAGMNSRTVFTACRPPAPPCGWPGRRCSSTRSAATAPSAWAPTPTAASTARPKSTTRCSASSGARGSHLMQADVAAVSARSIDAEATLRTALRPASDAAFGTLQSSGNYNANNDPKLQYDNPLTGNRAANPLAQQLQVVARMIDAGLSGASGARRQVFFVSLNGFDTHDLQNRNQADLMARLAHALPTSTPRWAPWVHATRSPPSRPATSAAPSRATATAPTTAGAATTLCWAARCAVVTCTGAFRCWAPRTPTTTALTAAPTC
jgi:uncharacterized protein (DUF1501 family)